jgi:gamma-tubulin complex component 3
VIESSWTELQKNIRKEDCTLDDLIRAHTKYLTAITQKGLLGAKRKQHVEAEAEDRNSYMVQLGELLRTMLAYRDSVDGLYSWSVSDFTRRQEADAADLLGRRRRHDDPRGEAGGVDSPDPFASAAGSSQVKSEMPALRERLRQLGASFRTRLQILLGDLAYQPDVDMRFLGVAMNFNDVYQPVRRKTKTAGVPATGEKGKG